MTTEKFHHRAIDFTGLNLGGNTGARGQAPLVDYDPSGTVVTVDSTTASSVAFPFTCTLRSGKHLVQYRVAADHDWNSSGVVKLKSSTDDAATWSAAWTMTDTAGGDDNAGGLCQLRDGTVLGLVVRRPSSTQSGWYSESMRSTDEGVTWNTPVTIDAGATGMEYATHVVALTNGDALAFLYCNSGGNDFIRVMATIDGGDSWTQRGTLTGTAGQDFQEPQAVVMPDGEIIVFLRYYNAGTREVRLARSVDDGATWTTPATILTNAGGQPAPHLTPNGLLVLAYRDHTTSAQDCRWATSKNRGNTWTTRGNFEATGNVYVYAGWLDLADGDLALVYGLELLADDTVSDTYSMRFTRRLDESVPAPGITVQDENGTVATGVTQIDFQGAGVAAGAGTGEVVVTIAGGGSTSPGELLMQDGVTAPPVPIETEARDDWLYQG